MIETKAPARDNTAEGKLPLSRAEHHCELCNRPGILTPRCAVCVRDHGYSNVVPIRRGRT